MVSPWLSPWTVLHNRRPYTDCSPTFHAALLLRAQACCKSGPGGASRSPPPQATGLLGEMAGVSSEQGIVEQNVRAGGSRGNIRMQEEPSHHEHTRFLHLFFIKLGYCLRTSRLWKMIVESQNAMMYMLPTVISIRRDRDNMKISTDHSLMPLCLHLLHPPFVKQEEGKRVNSRINKFQQSLLGRSFAWRDRKSSNSLTKFKECVE